MRYKQFIVDLSRLACFGNFRGAADREFAPDICRAYSVACLSLLSVVIKLFSKSYCRKATATPLGSTPEVGGKRTVTLCLAWPEPRGRASCLGLAAKPGVLSDRHALSSGFCANVHCLQLRGALAARSRVKSGLSCPRSSSAGWGYPSRLPSLASSSSPQPTWSMRRWLPRPAGLAVTEPLRAWPAFPS
ncbi:hypothetical protein PoB_003733200 [Plakobranchus ocellatus]|uniref:Uncharacterized protein n=1 Tax=Plakobranchus ocellatus TaxID=259542 RepID=A0AAV4AUY5_9GAST|nr:hypothetical protein PoB_003733200 [Plakobranchus ocellatus]